MNNWIAVANQIKLGPFQNVLFLSSYQGCSAISVPSLVHLNIEHSPSSLLHSSPGVLQLEMEVGVGGMQ